MENTVNSNNPDSENISPSWGESAPKGGKAVLNRILKENATVPLFFGQTLINSLRDLGYNSTISALCEHVDNALQWGATTIRVYFSQTGGKGNLKTDILVYDNGRGMPPNVLKLATSFGGSMVYGKRDGIGRYGMGMKTAALSMSPVMDLYSWQERGSIYNMVLDVDAIGRERSYLIELPEPNLLAELPSRVADILCKPMSFPKDVSEQQLLTTDRSNLNEILGESGTIVFMPNCDRLSPMQGRTLAEHAVRDMSRIYRKFLDKGIELFINNRKTEPFDPTYWMLNARHAKILDIPEKQSRLVLSKIIEIEKTENRKSDEPDTAPVTLRLYSLPIKEWSALPYKVRQNDLHVYEDYMVSVLRNDREVFIGTIPQIAKAHSYNNWLRVQIDFPGELDEAFGVAANKQGIRPKPYVLQKIAAELQDEIAALKVQIRKYQGEQSVVKSGSLPSASETKASEAEGFQSKPLPHASLSEEEQNQLAGNLKTLAILLKRENETDEDAFVRITTSRYIIHHKDDPYWPFYHVDYQFGKIILTINTAHPFYVKLYKPLSDAAITAGALGSETQTQADSDETNQHFEGAHEALIALQLMLFSLARAQSLMSVGNDSKKMTFEQMRREWSDAYQTQLTAP